MSFRDHGTRLNKTGVLAFLCPALSMAAFNFNWDPTLSPYQFEGLIQWFGENKAVETDPAKQAAWQDSIDLYIAKTDSIRQLAIPVKFSGLGFYSNMATKTVTPEAHPFQVNSALWSDGSHKHRWIVLPPSGKVAFKPDVDLFDYPDKAVLVKLFRLQKSAMDTATFPWETRLLVNHEEEKNGKMEDIWYFFTYKWKKDGSDADLVSLVNGFDTTYFANDIPNASDYVKWKFPGQTACSECHRKEVRSEPGMNYLGRAVLGFFPAQLSRTTATGNQITDLFAQEVFSGTPPTAAQLSRRWIGMDEPIPDSMGNDRTARDSVLNNMSRAYIAANCSGCHGTRGLDVSATHARINFDFHDLKYYPMGQLSPSRQLKWYEDTTKMRFQDSVFNSDFGTPGSALVRPGLPDQSVVIIRQMSRYSHLNLNNDPSEEISYASDLDDLQMPPLATYKVNEQAITVLKEWISYMPDSAGVVDPNRPAGIRAPREARSEMKAPVLLNRMLFVPEGWHGRIELISVKGRSIELRRSHGNTYAVPQGTPSGIYLIRIGERSFTRYLN